MFVWPWRAWTRPALSVLKLMHAKPILMCADKAVEHKRIGRAGICRLSFLVHQTCLYSGSKPVLQSQGREVSPIVPTVTGQQLVCLFDGVTSNEEVGKDVLSGSY